ncbi:MAG: hypothetical protein ABI618_11470 [Nitrospirota bacterium]
MADREAGSDCLTQSLAKAVGDTKQFITVDMVPKVFGYNEQKSGKFGFWLNYLVPK